jgi:hypothetical protein
MKVVKRLFIAFLWGLIVTVITCLIAVVFNQSIGVITGKVLFWGVEIVEPFLEPYFHDKTGMLDGPYRMILWLLSIVLELIVYTFFFYLLIGWRRKRSLKAAPQL